MEIAKYEAVETLRDGRRFKVRALRPDAGTSSSRPWAEAAPFSTHRPVSFHQQRFTDEQIAYFVNVDFVNHVALVAALEENGGPVIIGGGRYVVVQPGKAEVAFVVVDQYQGQGVGAALMTAILPPSPADAGLNELIAEVLADNISDAESFPKKRAAPEHDA